MELPPGIRDEIVRSMSRPRPTLRQALGEIAGWIASFAALIIVLAIIAVVSPFS